MLYVGTVPLILAFVGGLARPASRSTRPWRILIPVSFAVATMPRWWPQGYLYLLNLPGLGYFRVPARYTLLTCLGIALLAGEGFDRSISSVRFRLGLAAAILFGGCATVAAVFWTMQPDVNLRSTFDGVADGFLWAALAWSAALAIVIAWRSSRLGSWAPLFAVAVELGILYYAGTTQWGWSIAIPGQSPVLDELAREPSVGLVGGELDNLPVRAGLATAFPYLGFAHTYPDKVARAGCSSSSFDRVLPLAQTGPTRPCSNDGSGAAGSRTWSTIDGQPPRSARSEDAGATVRSIKSSITLRTSRQPAPGRSSSWTNHSLRYAWPPDRGRSTTVCALIDRLSRSDDQDIAWFLAENMVPGRPDARSARLLAWDGSAATVEHDGPCDLVIARSFDPGWMARIDDGPRRPVFPVNGGFQAVRLDGSGTHRVTLHYRTPRLTLWTAITIVAAILDLLVWIWLRVHGR